MGNVNIKELDRLEKRRLAQRLNISEEFIRQAEKEYKEIIYLNQEQKITKLTFAYHFFFDERYRAKAKDINVFLMEIVFAGFDEDCDGKLSFLEFLEGKNLFESKSRRNNLKFVFKLIDLNRNKRIEKKEIEQFLDKLTKAGLSKKSNSSKLAQEMIDELDGNQDGFIDEDEFIEGFVLIQKYIDFIDSIFVFKN